jgi:uncharacterized protein (TIGR02246 family)
MAIRSYSRSSAWLALLLVSFAPAVVFGQGIKRPTTPVRTARDELRAFREDYADAYNKKDSTAVANMYAKDAIVIQANGKVLVGEAAIRQAVDERAPKWGQMTLTSDSLRVIGSTALDVGTARVQLSEGGEQVSHYLAVLRRGLKSWKIARVAQVPETQEANRPDSATQR